MNNLYWIYIDYLIRMSTEQQQRFEETPSTTVTTNINVPIGNDRDSSQDGDSSDDELPSFAGGPQRKTPVVKLNLGEQEQEELELEDASNIETDSSEKASSSIGEIDETALSGKTTTSDDTFIGIRVPEEEENQNITRDEINEGTPVANQGSSFGIDSSSSDDSSGDTDLAESDKTDAPGEQNVAPGEQNVTSAQQNVTSAQQNVIEAEREVAAAQQGVTAAQQQVDDIKREIEENTYIRTHINGVLDGDDDALFMKLSSPDNATTFYEERYDTNNTDQKELIPFIFLFTKTYRKIQDSFEKINSLLQEDNKNSEINSQLTTLQGQLQMFYELPLQHKDGEQLISNPDYYFGENQPSVVIIEGKAQIFFETEDGQKDWGDFTDYFTNNVSLSYNKGKVQFEPNAKKSVKQFKEKYLTKKSSSIMSKMGSMFGSRQGGNKKQTRRPVIHKKRQTRRK